MDCSSPRGQARIQSISYKMEADATYMQRLGPPYAAGVREILPPSCSTLWGCLHDSQSTVATYEAQKLITAAEERTNVRWNYL